MEESSATAKIEITRLDKRKSPFNHKFITCGPQLGGNFLIVKVD
jgi:hypothetical protein